MADLSPVAVEHLWPVLQIAGAAALALVSLIIGLWRGFSWLQSQIEKTAMAMVGPVSETAILAKKSASRSHWRIDKLRRELNLESDRMDDLETKP